MRNVLLPSTRLPYHIVKGSVAARAANSEKLTQKIYESLSEGIKTDKTILKFETIQNRLLKLIPGVKVKVQKSKKPDCEALIDVFGSKKGIVYGYLLGIKRPENKVRVGFFPMLMHEIQHLSDYLYNPKNLAREQKLIKIQEKFHKYNNFYLKYMYDEYPSDSPQMRKLYMYYVKSALYDFVKKADENYIIDFLQDIRYTLKSETNAYKKQIEYAHKLQEKGFKINPQDFQERIKYFMFEEKIKLLEETLYILIKKQRMNNAQKINK